MTAPVSVERLQRLAAAELSVAARLRYAALLLVSLAGAGLVASLWITEPDLPARTHAAFAAIVLVATGWAALAARALATRRVLFARHRVTVAWMAVAVSGLMLAGAAVAWRTGAFGAASGPAAGFAALMLAASVVALIAARRRVASLVARRQALERQLDGATGRTGSRG